MKRELSPPTLFFFFTPLLLSFSLAALVFVFYNRLPILLIFWKVSCPLESAWQSLLLLRQTFLCFIMENMRRLC